MRKILAVISCIALFSSHAFAENVTPPAVPPTVTPVSFSAVPLTTSVGNVSSIVLPYPGKWRVSVFLADTGDAGAVTGGLMCLTQTTASLTGCTYGVNYIGYPYNAVSGYGSGSIPGYDVTVAGQTTIFLNALTTGAGATNGVSGTIHADLIH